MREEGGGREGEGKEEGGRGDELGRREGGGRKREDGDGGRLDLYSKIV